MHANASKTRSRNLGVGSKLNNFVETNCFMKIGLLTFHYVNNLGSVLQAYCGFRLIQEQFADAHVEIIDLVPRNRQLRKWIICSKRWPFLRLDRIKRNIDFDRFLKRRTSCSPRCYATKLEKQTSFIDAQGYDIVFVGSDTVWMRSSKLGNQLPSVYFLPKVEARKVGLAVSMDPLLNPEAYLEKKERLREVLGEFEAILVRDGVTSNLLESIGFRDFERIADPVILHDFEKELPVSVRRKAPVQGVRSVAIALNDHKTAAILGGLLKTAGFEVIFLYAKSGIFRNIFLDEIAECSRYDAIITDRFHFCIISMKLSSSLVINLELNSRHPLENSKGRDLFSQIGIEEYFFCHKEDDIERTFDFVIQRINAWSETAYDERNQSLRKFIERNQDVWRVTAASLKRG